jgi:UDP-4-amino-4-deoxy-L-arabinose formyltransferase / UDP-glucuronic acid dehydrogenase (UDP-4-keto-hexauronic acid decarboxylating)
VSGGCVFFGYHTFGARALAALLGRGEAVTAVVTHADQPGEGDWFESVADVARAHGVPVLTPASPNAPDVVSRLAALEAEVFVSVWYRRLLADQLLAVPRVAAVNLHGSLLPAYRGRAPLNWVLVNGERTTGVTLHHMTRDADAGDIVAQEAIEITSDDTALSLYGRMVKTGVDLLLEWYPAVRAGTAPRRAQDHARATLVGRRGPEDGRVQWTWPARRIADMIRAVTHPYPGAFVGDGTARIHLWEGAVEGTTAAAAPGTVTAIDAGRGITVATGDGTLRLTRVQAAGGPEQRADLWAQATGRLPGARMEAI